MRKHAEISMNLLISEIKTEVFVMDNNQNNFSNEQNNVGGDTPLFTQAYIEVKSNKRGFAVASLVLGILSIVCCCLSYAGFVMALLAVIFAVVSKTKMGYFDPLAVAGLVLGIIGLVFGAAIIICDLLARFGVFSEFEEMFNEFLETPPAGEL